MRVRICRKYVLNEIQLATTWKFLNKTQLKKYDTENAAMHKHTTQHFFIKFML